ncbi:MAG: hypothetical protein U0527_01780 [Candidatus Eisenbacteria bacterium]
MRARNRGPFIACGAVLLTLGIAGSPPPAEAAAQIYGGFPEIDASARSVALGGNLAALAAGAEALGSNPAGLLDTDAREVTFGYADLFGLGLISHSSAQAAWPLLGKSVQWDGGEIRTVRRPPPANRALGVAVSNLSTDIEPDRYDETQLTVAFASRGFLGFRWGADYRLLWAQSNLEDVGANGHAMDFGVKRQWRSLTVGFAARNLASSVNWQRGLDEPLAKRFQLAAAFRPLRPLTLQATTEWVGDAGSRRASSLGVECAPVAALTLRGAIRQREDAVDSSTEWSAGAGFQAWKLRIAYGISHHAQELGDTQRWSGSFQF